MRKKAYSASQGIAISYTGIHGELMSSGISAYGEKKILMFHVELFYEKNGI